MIQITLACAAGMSTSLLVSKMEKYATENHLKVKIVAVAEKQMSPYLNKTDVLMLSPQVSFLEKKYREKLAGTGIGIGTIPILEYGRMDGGKVLERALKIYQGNKEE